MCVAAQSSVGLLREADDLTIIFFIDIQSKVILFCKQFKFGAGEIL